jgi:hypothetical protein
MFRAAADTTFATRAETTGYFASFLSCLRFAAERSLGLSGLVSGVAKMRSSHSISAMVCSVSIGTNDLAESRDGSNGTGARRTIEHEQNTAGIPRRRPL